VAPELGFQQRRTLYGLPKKLNEPSTAVGAGGGDEEFEVHQKRRVQLEDEVFEYERQSPGTTGQFPRAPVGYAVFLTR